MVKINKKSFFKAKNVFIGSGSLRGAVRITTHDGKQEWMTTSEAKQLGFVKSTPRKKRNNFIFKMPRF